MRLPSVGRGRRRAVPNEIDLCVAGITGAA